MPSTTANEVTFTLSHAPGPDGVLTLPPGMKEPELGSWTVGGLQDVVHQYNDTGRVSVHFRSASSIRLRSWEIQRQSAYSCGASRQDPSSAVRISARCCMHSFLRRKKLVFQRPLMGRQACSLRALLADADSAACCTFQDALMKALTAFASALCEPPGLEFQVSTSGTAHVVHLSRSVATEVQPQRLCGQCSKLRPYDCPEHVAT